MTPDVSVRPSPPRLRPAGPVIRAEDVGVWAEAGAAIHSAERYAKRMRSWARTIREHERARGFAEGRRDGAEEAARLVAETATRAEIYLRELERDLPDLVLGLVERVIGSLEPDEALARIVAEALRTLRTAAEVRVQVAPDAIEALRAALRDPRHRLDGGPAVRVEADPALGPGACVLHSPVGTVELGLAEQLRALRDGIEAAWRDRRHQSAESRP